MTAIQITPMNVTQKVLAAAPSAPTSRNEYSPAICARFAITTMSAMMIAQPPSQPAHGRDDEPEGRGEAVAGRGRGTADDDARDEPERTSLQPLVARAGGCGGRRADRVRRHSIVPGLATASRCGSASC